MSKRFNKKKKKQKQQIDDHRFTKMMYPLLFSNPKLFTIENNHEQGDPIPYTRNQPKKRKKQEIIMWAYSNIHYPLWKWCNTDRWFIKHSKKMPLLEQFELYHENRLIFSFGCFKDASLVHALITRITDK